MAGFGLTQSATDGTKDVAKAVFYKKVKTVHLKFRARAELNTDEDGMSLATHVQVFTLKDRQTFDKVDNTLISDEEHALNADLAAKKKCKSARNKWCHLPCRWTSWHNLLPSSHSTARRIFVKMIGGKLDREEFDPDKARIVELEKHCCTCEMYKNNLD